MYQRFLSKVSSLKTTIISTIVFVLFMIIVLPFVSNYSDEVTGGAPSPDTAFFASPSDIYDIVSQYDENARSIYINLRVTFDVVWPLVYFFFIAIGIYMLSKNKLDKKLYSIGLLTPLLAILFDFLENMFAIVVMALYPKEVPFLAYALSISSALKWIVISFAFIWLIVLLIIFVTKKIKKDN